MASLLLDQIERDVLDESASVAAALRKCVVLGGRSGSVPLSDWATRELEGYHGSNELPDYRRLAAPIQLDGITGNMFVTGQAVAPSALPDFVRDVVKEQVELRDGIGQIEQLASMAEIKLGLPGGGDLVRVMNAEIGEFQRIDRIYWALSPAAVRGVLDQVRTALTKLVAELHATTPRGQEVPSAEEASQALNFVVTGKRAKVSVSAAQATGSAPALASTSGAGEEAESGTWTTSRRIGAAVVGVATIAAAIFGAIEVL